MTTFLNRNVRRTKRGTRALRTSTRTLRASRNIELKALSHLQEDPALVPLQLADFRGVSREFLIHEYCSTIFKQRDVEDRKRLATAIATATLTPDVYAALNHDFDATVGLLEGSEPISDMWRDGLAAYFDTRVSSPDEALALMRYVLFLRANRVGFTDYYLGLDREQRETVRNGWRMMNAQFL